MVTHQPYHRRVQARNFYYSGNYETNVSKSRWLMCLRFQSMNQMQNSNFPSVFTVQSSLSGQLLEMSWTLFGERPGNFSAKNYAKQIDTKSIELHIQWNTHRRKHIPVCFKHTPVPTKSWEYQHRHERKLSVFKKWESERPPCFPKREHRERDTHLVSNMVNSEIRVFVLYLL